MNETVTASVIKGAGAAIEATCDVVSVDAVLIPAFAPAPQDVTYGFIPVKRPAGYWAVEYRKIPDGAVA